MASPFTLTLTVRACREHDNCVVVTDDEGNPSTAPVAHHLGVSEAANYAVGCAAYVLYRATVTTP